MKKLNIGMIGYKFMGKAHSNAWKQAPHFFDVAAEPVLKVACGRHAGPLQEFADRWGWEEIETDWQKVVKRDDIDIIDIGVPTHLHHDIAVAAAKAGKHIFCEKPIALTVQDADRIVILVTILIIVIIYQLARQMLLGQQNGMLVLR
ncbi:hypothetical protein LCGC14_3097820 [marine sediment metagenome]|uniref:Gfo/Idh/MocA-like oxidoreductase N-terminal domain-containing protein n=1 Tax=marine sediment metagenome TaxID=412755 RepID=A0A0F8WXG3_9ZZZZ